MQIRAQSSRLVTADVRRDPEGKPTAFTLSIGSETIYLDPGISWARADTGKWIVRGIIEQPQSFHVEADGTVEINGEKISLHDPVGTARLELEINKHHDLPAARKESAAGIGTTTATAAAHAPDHVVFRVRLDQLGHLHIDCCAGEERTATSLRGLSSLIQNGLMLKPGQLHVDPMQRHVEIDGVLFECNEAGARQLENALNYSYAPALKDSRETPISVRENPASPTGFDIRFESFRAGARSEVKGHLSEEKLEMLQDPIRSNLVKPGMLLRLTPPFLIVRRRRPDGGEEKVPELPDLQYLRSTAIEIQQFLNHPLVRRGAGSATPATRAEAPAELVELRVRRRPQNQLSLWLEPVTTKGRTSEGCAFTRHNLAEFQHAGHFLPHLDVALSLDNKQLSVLNKSTGEEQHLIVDANSTDEDLARAGRMLTASLKTPIPRPPQPAAYPEVAPHPVPVERPALDPRAGPPAPASAATRPTDSRCDSTTPLLAPVTPMSPLPAAPAARSPSPAVQAPAHVAPLDERRPLGGTGVAAREQPAVPLSGGGPGIAEADGFRAADPLETVQRVFQAAAEGLALPVQEVALSLPLAFTDRQFQVLAFDGRGIESVQDLRSETFAGFYLTHLNSQDVLLVYANQGRHIEFGPQRCELQTAVSAEPDEFNRPGLLGLAQDRDGNFVFVVTSAFRAWVRPREKLYLEAAARFLTPAETAASPQDFALIWPRGLDAWAKDPTLESGQASAPILQTAPR